LNEPHIRLQPIQSLIDSHRQSCLKQPDIVRIGFRLCENLRQIGGTCTCNRIHHAQRRITLQPDTNLSFRYP